MNTDEYATIAPYYDKLLSSLLTSLRKNICTFLHYHNHTKIIDVCCGTGEQLKMLDADNMELTGVDLSPAMLNQAGSSQNIHFIQQNAAEIVLSDQNFDAVLLTFALHEKNELDRDVIFKKCWEIVRPGGHLIIGDYGRFDSSVRGVIFNKILIPVVERLAGIDHYHCYKNWMENGALEGFLRSFPHKIDIISTHFYGSVILISIAKESELNAALRTVNLPD